MSTVSIATEPSPYEAVIEGGLLAHAGEQIKSLYGDQPRRVFVVTVPPVRKHWMTQLSQSLKDADLGCDLLEMKDGERFKTAATAMDLAARMVKAGADRNAVVIGFGGGVAGDVAGFLASIYMRGVDVVQIPTTFLAQVDASIGGKTGVNLTAGKNLIGTFHQPRRVIIDPNVLSTLPEREFRSGLYEALKCGIIGNAEIFDFMEQHRERILQREPEALHWLITESVKVKAQIVAVDERESDQRRVLNFGHTIGHALEAETGYKQFHHGEAVAWGMIAASMIAAAMQRTASETARRIISTVLAYAPLPRVEVKAKNVARRIMADKKTVNGVAHFVFPSEIGKAEIVPNVPGTAITQAIEEIRYLSKA